MNSNLWNIDHSWSLFLDRDGVINQRLPADYVKTHEDFRFIADAKEAIATLTKMFSRLIVVTNQQGVGKGLMTEETLQRIHQYMVSEILRAGGKIDLILFAPHLARENNIMRKPNIGMALKAKRSYPEIQFRKSIMVGDSIHDIIFGKRVGMKTVLIADDLVLSRKYHKIIDLRCGSLVEFAEHLTIKQLR